jgi:hypothetical protein
MPRKGGEPDLTGSAAKPRNRKPTYDELAEMVAQLEPEVARLNLVINHIHADKQELNAKYLASRTADLHLEEGNVEWVVNDIGELGVKIGNQFFFLYKGRSLVYGDRDPGPTMRWRLVYKREFGEVCHPPPKTQYSFDRGELNQDGTYTFGNEEDWQDLPFPKET